MPAERKPEFRGLTPALAPAPGIALHLRPDLALVLAPNPSPMTQSGTNTYLIGTRALVVIDPGPDDAAHLDALLRVIAGRAVDLILVTHTHRDHSPLARPLARATGAPVLAFGDHLAGRSAMMQALADGGLLGGGEGIDHDFRPDRILGDGAEITGDWGRITALHTPGHIGNHLCFQWGDALFSGDHVMGWASSLVSPPDGDLTDFMASCERLRTIDLAVLYPGHGAPVTEPMARIDWLIGHRRNREWQILQALAASPADLASLARSVYHDIVPAMMPAAERNLLAHLIDLFGRGSITASPRLAATAIFALAPGSQGAQSPV